MSGSFYETVETFRCCSVWVYLFFFALGYIRPADDETALVIVSEHIICSLFSSTSPTYTGQEAHIARKTVTPGTS